MKRHDLKIWPEHFENILYDKKRFEIRKYDRDYNEGDVLRLNEWCPKEKKYTGNIIDRSITLISRDVPGLKKGYCIMSLEGPF